MKNTPVYQHQDLPLPAHPRVWAEISAEALTHNYKALAACNPSAEPVAVVKADAYGHGIALTVPALVEAGCRRFAVATPEEALSLRWLLSSLLPEETPMILILGYVHPHDVWSAALQEITLTCLSLDHAEALSRAAVDAGVTVSCHVALDTGMNRIGLDAQSPEAAAQASRDVMAIMDMEGLRVTGMFTHFSTADHDFEEVNAPDSLTRTQFTRYMAVYNALCAAGKRPAFCHVCNSAAATRCPDLMPEAALDGVRFGISMYGYGVNTPRDLGLRPVMRLKTKIVHLHTCPAGGRVGYGGEYAPETSRVIATLPVGYADGFTRGFKGAEVRVHTSEGEQIVSLVGRVCMDQCMADVTDTPVSVGDEVTLFGDTCASLGALCERSGTIPYEPLCLISARVPRYGIE